MQQTQYQKVSSLIITSFHKLAQLCDQFQENNSAALKLNFTSTVTWREGGLGVNMRQILSHHFNS